MAPFSHPALDPPVEADAHYFTVEELRNEQDVPDTFSDAQVEQMRALAEEVIEDGAGVAFLPRRRTEVISTFGPPRMSAPLVRELEGVSIDGDDWTPEEVADRVILDGRYIVSPQTWGRAISLTYTHGYDVPPARIRRAAMILTRVWLTRGPVDDRATQIAADGATINLATPGLQGFYTGVPEVDAAIHDFRHHGYVFS